MDTELERAYELSGYDGYPPYRNLKSTIIDSYEKFLEIRLANENCRVPPLLQIMWKNHVLNTEDYYGFCNRKFQNIIHCDIREFGKFATEDEIAYTMEIMKKHFGETVELNTKIWNVCLCIRCNNNCYIDSMHECCDCKKIEVCLKCCSSAIDSCPTCKKTHGYEIFVITRIGKKLTITTLLPYSTILELKQAVQTIEGITVGEQRIIFDGKHLDNEKMLSDYDIQKYSTLRFGSVCGRGC